MAADNGQLDLFGASEPLFRWAGGKRRLLRQIIPLIPRFNHYYEPFCGGAALFFSLRPPRATLGDKNEELINCYIQVRNQPEEVIASLQCLQNSEAEYYRIREISLENKIDRAARFIYLMELSFNGLYRVNSDGKFNVPYGQKPEKKIDFEKIRKVSQAFENVDFVCRDFQTTVADAKFGDLVYFDPPYTVSHGNNGFVQYNENIFSWKDQIKLANVADGLVHRGCTVIVSNAEHDLIQELYTNFKTHRVIRHSGIGGLPKTRKHIREFVFTK